MSRALQAPGFRQGVHDALRHLLAQKHRQSEQSGNMLVPPLGIGALQVAREIYKLLEGVTQIVHARLVIRQWDAICLASFGALAIQDSE